MEGNKLELSGKTNNDTPVAATYKPIPETDMEDETTSRPKSVVKVKTSPVADGADEKMLPKEDKIQHSINLNNLEAKISENEKQNGDAKLDIGEFSTAFVGMGKEELMKYANDPFWVRLRWFLFITFWVLWAAMLVGAVLIIYAAPKCDPPPPRTWWQEGPLTEGESVIKVDDIKSLNENIKGIILPWPEDTYASVNDSHEIFKLIGQAKEKGIKVIIELEPAVSSVWFEKSEAEDPVFSDYYIWKAPKMSPENKLQPPNNWISMKNNSSWKYSEKRKQYYYSPFDTPHLNFRNVNVTKEFSNVIEKFLELEAAGIRVRNAASLLVDSKFEDEIMRSDIKHHYDHTEYHFYVHRKTENLDELGQLLLEWRTIVRNKTGDGPFMVAEELTRVDSYKVNDTLVVDLPLLSHIISERILVVNDTVSALNYSLHIDKIDWPLWKANTTALPNDVLDIVTYLLPGVPLVKNGSEEINSELLKIRNSPSVTRGTVSIHSIHDNSVLAYVRVTSGNPGILVALNPSVEKVVVSFPQEIPALSELNEVTVRMFSKNYNETNFMDTNAKKDASAIPISPKSAIVLSYVPKSTK